MPIFVVLCICGNDVTYFGCQEVIESVFLLFLNFVLVYYYYFPPAVMHISLDTFHQWKWSDDDKKNITEE